MDLGREGNRWKKSAIRPPGACSGLCSPLPQLGLQRLSETGTQIYSLPQLSRHLLPASSASAREGSIFWQVGAGWGKGEG